jgi:signal transduction histidine kinase
MVGQVAFGGWWRDRPRPEALEYAVFPLLIWAALRFGPGAAAGATLTVCALAVPGAVAGFGPFAGGSLKQDLMFLQAFLAVVAMTSLAVAAITAERGSAQRALEDSRERLRNLSVRLQSIREEERKLIAREIHDQLGQALTVLKVDLSLLGQKRPRDVELVQRTESMSELVDSSIDTVRRLSSELRPRVLDDLGLAAAIEWQAQEFQKRTGIRCAVEIWPQRLAIDPERSTACFRIFQEALTNVARHAKASRIFVSLRLEGDRIWLRIKDDGRGISSEKLSDPKASGLVGMRERVHPWQGEVSVRGIPDQGTEVTVMIPLSVPRAS